MKTIYKYQLNITDRQEILMPKYAEVLAVQVQNGIPCLWVLVNDDLPKQKRVIRMAGTGHELTDETIDKYVGSFQMSSGDLIFHVFITEILWT